MTENYGKLWVFPAGASDIVPVTGDVMSYEHDGTLTIAEPSGVLAGPLTINYEHDDDGLIEHLDPAFWAFPRTTSITWTPPLHGREQ